MNMHTIQILFLKDLFLGRRPLFGYLMAGLTCAGLACVPQPTVAYAGSILVITVAIASGIHLIAHLLLAETHEQTRMFVMSLPVSLWEYSLAKIAVVLTAYLIPWSAMLACSLIFTFILPGAKVATVGLIPVIFLFLLAAFTIQLVTAVVTESVGFTICAVVACNVALNLFLKYLYELPEIVAADQNSTAIWTPVLTVLVVVELAVIVMAVGMAHLIQSRPRDLI